MEIHFYAEKKSKKKYTIYLRCYINGESVKYYPKIQCEDWDNENRAKGFNKKNINGLLRQLELKAYDIEHDLRRENKLSKENFLRVLRGDTNIANDFFTVFDEYIELSKSTLSESTIRQYGIIKRNLELFDAKEKIVFNNIDISFYDRLIKFFLEERGMTNNTAGHQVQKLKAFLNNLRKRGYNFKFAQSDFKVFKEKTTIVYLTQEELEKVYTAELETERLQKSRDLFILQASTGLRYSDLMRLGKEHIHGNIIRLKAHKTKKDIIVPITPKASEVLLKYDYKIPYYSDTTQNLSIKDVCEIAKINSLVEVPIYKGGSKTYETYFKHQLVTTHTAVKTFITHCGEKGISAKVVSEITGKTVEVILKHYYGTNEKLIESEIQRAFGKI